MSTNENSFETVHWDTEQVRRKHVKAPKGKKKKKIKMGWLIYILSVILVSFLLAEIGWLLVNDVCALNKEPLTTSVSITDGDGVGEVTAKLKEAGLITYKMPFKIFAKVFHAEEKIQPGVYELNTNMDYRCIIGSMHNTSGVAATVDITIPEGYTNEQIFELLAANSVSNVDSLREAAKNFRFTDFPFVDNDTLGDAGRLEGYLFPDTYNFYVNESAVSALSRIMRNFQSKVDEIAGDIENSGMSIHDLVTMASIVELESTGDENERKNVASVMYNRMATKDRETYGYLQMDTTVYYAIARDGLRRDQFPSSDPSAYESPYNTYRYPGLPKGPICNPGIASIKAALHPNKTNYFYFAAGKDGVSHFFRTYSEHLNFVNSSMYQPS